jgi:threonine/homoserine/homoserine lactone efflux protein
MGSYYLLRSPAQSGMRRFPDGLHYAGFFSQGFLINFVNPFIFVLWIGLAGLGHGKYPVAYAEFTGGILMGILSGDILKAAFAQRLKRILHPRYLRVAFRIAGVALILFGLRVMLWIWEGISLPGEL